LPIKLFPAIGRDHDAHTINEMVLGTGFR
jgi:hypothetical protein